MEYYKEYNNSFLARAKHSRNGLPRFDRHRGYPLVSEWSSFRIHANKRTQLNVLVVLIDVRIQYTVEHIHTTTRIHISLLELVSSMSVNYNLSFADSLRIRLKRKKTIKE